MSYAIVDDRMPENPKVVALSDRAFRAYVEGLCYASGALTDGFLSAAVVTDRRRWRKASGELIAAGLWEQVDGGYQVHDYLKHQRSRAEVEDLREKRSRAGAKGGKKRASATASDEANASDVLAPPIATPTANADLLSVTGEAEMSSLPPLTIDQASLLRNLHRRVSDEVFGGTDFPTATWCEDLVRRGMTAGDVDAAITAMRPSAAERRGMAYGRAVLLRRVEEREHGNDPDQRAAGGARPAGGGTDVGPAGPRGLAARGAGRAATAPTSEYANDWRV